MMERIHKDGKEYLIGYHTQEYRALEQQLIKPIKCTTQNAWLGYAYYFWLEREFADYWGEDFKKATGFYDVYTAEIDFENCINSVFDEVGYYFFRSKIEEAIEYFDNKGIPFTLEKVHRWLAENIWPKLNVSGIIYDDKPINSNKSDRIHSEIPDLYYKKRIQIGLFNLSVIHNFEILEEEIEC